MNITNRIAIFSVISTALALSGCGKSEPTPSSATTPAVVAAAAGAAATAAASPAAQSKKLAEGNTEREQGTMEIDAGSGMQSLRSMATVIDPKLGEKAAARLGTSEGQKTLADANASVPASMGVSGTPKVTTNDIQDMANSFAGRTVYSSQAMHAKIINAYVIELDAKSTSEPGVRMNVAFNVSEKDLTLQSAKLEYYPDAGKRTQSFVKKKLALTDLTIDKLERKDENTFVVSGSFKATDLEPGVLAKDLKGQTLPVISGRFDFAEVPIRKMGI